MQRVGLDAVRDPKTGTIIYATGYTLPVRSASKPTTNQPLSCDNQVPDSVRSIKDDDDCLNLPPPTSDSTINFAGDQGTTALTYVSQTLTPPPPAVPTQWWSTQVLPYTSVYGLYGPLASAQFQPPRSPLVKCEVQIALATSAALSMAGYIVANASRYSAVVVASAEAAIARWNGTTLGIAASLTFLGGLVGALTLPEWLTLLGVAGASAATIWAAYQCYNGIYG